MNPRTTGVLALVALVLGAFVYFYEIEGESGRDAERAAEKRLFAGVEADAVGSIELTTSDGVAARFERREGAWRIVSPVEGEGDAMALDAIASALASLSRAGTVKSAPGDLEQFGLGADAQVVRFDAKGASHALRIGRATPVGGNVYVAAEGSDEVSYVESYRLNALKHGLTDLRNRRILALDAARLRRLLISWPQEGGVLEVELERGPDDAWQIRRPVTGRADQQTIRELLANLEYLQAAGFIDERTPAVEKALSETAIAFAWSTGDAPEAGRFRVAGLLDGTRVVESGGRLFRLAPERLDDFQRRLTAYRDKQLFELEPTAIERIELEFAGHPAIGLDRGDAGWGAEGREVDPEAVAVLAESLATLRASDIVADEMGAAELASVGLAQPAVRIRVRAATGGAAGAGAGKEPGSTPGLELGRLDPERGLFARRAGEPTIYALAQPVAESLPLTLEAFDARYGKKAPEAEPEASSVPGAAPAPDGGSASAPSSPSDLVEE